MTHQCLCSVFGAGRREGPSSVGRDGGLEMSEHGERWSEEMGAQHGGDTLVLGFHRCVWDAPGTCTGHRSLGAGGLWGGFRAGAWGLVA